MGELLFLAGLFVIFGWVCFVFLTKRGRGIMFGGTIVKTWDGVVGKRRIVTTRVKVHAVDAAPTLRFVGLELSMSSFGGYQMVPISLPAGEAKALAQMLIDAAEYRHGAAGT